jgi:ATP-dependent 26S proteasome regulatory subunit
VISTRNGLSTIPQDIKNTKIDIGANYGEKFVKVHDKIVEKLNDPLGKGLVLLHGVPGTGKTSYIRHLCKEIKKEIIFLPPFLAENIAGPDFIPFLLDHTNSILIIEDAEKVVLDREGDGSNRQSVANLLNMTDGILSDCLSIQILATFNTTRDKIDKALLRKGRLIAEWKFDPLEVDQSNKLLKKLGKDFVTDVPMTLTDIYNLEEEVNVVKQEENKIGFRNY